MQFNVTPVTQGFAYAFAGINALIRLFILIIVPLDSCLFYLENMNLESPKVTVEKSAEYLFTALSDVKNFEKLI